MAAPSGEHFFGTDAAGRDLFSRVVYSARTTLLFTLAVIVTGSLLLGLFPRAGGGLPGRAGGRRHHARGGDAKRCANPPSSC